MKAAPLTGRTAAAPLVDDEACGAARAEDTVGGAVARAAVEWVSASRGDRRLVATRTRSKSSQKKPTSSPPLLEPRRWRRRLDDLAVEGVAHVPHLEADRTTLDEITASSTVSPKTAANEHTSPFTNQRHVAARFATVREILLRAGERSGSREAVAASAQPLDASVSGGAAVAPMPIVRGQSYAAVIGASAWSPAAHLGRRALSLTAIPATRVVPVRGQGAILNVTVLEIPPAGVAIS